MEPLDLSDLDDQPESRDFRRANGAPMVRRVGDPTKWDRYSRPSGWGGDLDDESNLTLWRIDRAMEGVASSPALCAKVAANVGRKEGRKDRRDLAIQLGRGEEAADLGTALHAMAERLETEPGFAAPEPYATDLAAYLSTIDAAGLVTRYTECHICADHWRAAGTADRIYEATRELTLPDGSLVVPGTTFIGDLKTGARLDYSLPGFAIQLAIYADGDFYDVDTNERTPLPGTLHTGWGVLVHLPAGTGTCELMWADLSVGREGAETVRAVRSWRKRDDFAQPFTMPASDEEAILYQTVDFVEILHEPPPLDDEGWNQAMCEWAQARINTIGEIPEARALLIRRWPEGTPTVREGGLTTAQVTDVLDLIAAIEAAFSLPFPVGDPREEWNRGLARGEGVRGHTPPTQEQ